MLRSEVLAKRGYLSSNNVKSQNYDSSNVYCTTMNNKVSPPFGDRFIVCITNMHQLKRQRSLRFDFLGPIILYVPYADQRCGKWLFQVCSVRCKDFFQKMGILVLPS